MKSFIASLALGTAAIALAAGSASAKTVPVDDGQALHPRVIELARQFGYE